MLIKEILRKNLVIWGIDKSIFFSCLAKIIQCISGLLVVLLIANFLSSSEQGYYYTFSSLIAIQVFFELGLNNILNQFVSHEFVNVSIINNRLIGIQYSLSRIASLFRFTFRVYIYLCAILFVCLLLFGVIFFHNYSGDIHINWITPWIILTFATCLYFFITPFLSILQGLGQIKVVTKILMIQQLISSLILILSLLLNFKLYSSGLAILISTMVTFFLVRRKLWFLFRSLLNVSITNKVSYREEIFPYQWKLALGWIGSYFIFQLFNPVIFANEGAKMAGRMGMTLTILNSIMALSDSWITTKIPLFSGLIAQKRFYDLDLIFRKTQIQSVCVNSILLIIFILGVGIFSSENLLGTLSDRFLPLSCIILLSFTILMRQLYGSWAIYLRCHKKEPLLIQSIVMAVLCSISTFTMGHYWGTIGIVVGYTILTIFSTLWIYFIFKNKRYEWHK